MKKAVSIAIVLIVLGFAASARAFGFHDPEGILYNETSLSEKMERSESHFADMAGEEINALSGLEQKRTEGSLQAAGSGTASFDLVREDSRPDMTCFITGIEKINPHPVPEPSTILTLAFSLIGFEAFRRKMKS